MTLIRRNPDTHDELLDWWEAEALDDDVQLVVATDDAALLVAQDGEVLLECPPGRHRLTADEYPDLKDWLDGEDDELTVYFLSTAPQQVGYSGSFTHGKAEVTFSGTATLKVTDASSAIGLLEKLGDGEPLVDWLGDELAVHVAEVCAQWPGEVVVVTSTAFNDEVLAAVLPKAHDVLSAWGVEVVEFDVAALEFELDEATTAELGRKLQEDMAARANAPWVAPSYCPNRHGYVQGPTCPRCQAPAVVATKPPWLT